MFYSCNFAIWLQKDDVEKFLENFYLKVKVFGIRFRDDRDKNRNAFA